jgi:hypothetical protein
MNTTKLSEQVLNLDLEDILEPETELEKEIILDPSFREGAVYGKPRKGHPEGKVVYHIREVLDNIDKYSEGEERTKLRLIALLHDTFKYKVDYDKPKKGDNHHGMIARRFAEDYIQDEQILEILELHDEAYNSWQKGNRDNNWERAYERAGILIERLGSTLDLYLKFYRCDNETGDKVKNSVVWFCGLI